MPRTPMRKPVNRLGELFDLTGKTQAELTLFLSLKTKKRLNPNMVNGWVNSGINPSMVYEPHLLEFFGLKTFSDLYYPL